MRIQICSDLHLEFGGPEFKLGPTGRDVLVLAGDVHVGTKADKFILAQLEKSDVVYLMGNHEFYRQVLPQVRWAWTGPTKDRINKEAQELGYLGRLHVLDNHSVVINEVRFLGTTLWTDFQKENPLVMNKAGYGMNDYQQILMRTGDIYNYGGIKATPHDTLHLHKVAVEFLKKELAQEFDGPTVVATHMAPSWQSIPEAFRGDPLNGAFVSDLSDLILDAGYELHIHGHTHNNFDYHIGKTRVVCNPRGYVGYEINPDFKDDLYIDI